MSASRHLLPPTLEAFATRYPGISVPVTEGTDHEAEQWPRAGTVDAGFLNHPGDEFATLPLAVDELVALLPADHPLAPAARVLDPPRCRPVALAVRRREAAPLPSRAFLAVVRPTIERPFGG
ncbi:MAG TPA: LysR family transcriptional regulator substrate-binding protein [Gemmatimonadales bacterium]|nr:LysR family transcriptional regulator substrate-binding protein [Gemmatimonadales bacterium]